MYDLNDYNVAFRAIQEQVDKGAINISLAERLVKFLNKDAKDQGVPFKIDPEYVKLTPANFPVNVADDTSDDLSSSDF